MFDFFSSVILRWYHDLDLALPDSSARAPRLTIIRGMFAKAWTVGSGCLKQSRAQVGIGGFAHTGVRATEHNHDLG